jgi:hypothetical protein
MKRIFFLVLLSGSLAYAHDSHLAQSGTILQMDSVACGTDQNSSKSFAGEMIGTDSGHQKTKTLLCQEYLVQTDRVTYRIRPKDEKHPALLPVGERAQFHIEKDHMKLHVEDLDNKDREYFVVSVMPRSDVQTAQNTK